MREGHDDTPPDRSNERGQSASRLISIIPCWEEWDSGKDRMIHHDDDDVA